MLAAVSGCATPYRAPAGGPVASLSVQRGSGLGSFGAETFSDPLLCTGLSLLANTSAQQSLVPNLPISAARLMSVRTSGLGYPYMCVMTVSFYVHTNRKYRILGDLEGSVCRVSVVDETDRSRPEPVHTLKRTPGKMLTNQECAAVATSELPTATSNSPRQDGDRGTTMHDLKGLLPPQ
jgi:hypothetical protein